MEDLLNTLLDNFFSVSCLNGNIEPLDSYEIDSSELKSGNGAQNNFLLFNFTSKPIAFHWVDYKGKEQECFGIINVNSSQTLGTFVSHCFRIYYNSQDKSEGSVFIKIPESNFGYIGDFEQIKNKIKETCWLNNLDKRSLDACEFLSTNETVLDNLELILIGSYFYDDSAQVQSKISQFLSYFNKENKFIDPFFNPLNEIDTSKYTLKRIGETSLSKKLTLNGHETRDVGESFNFSIKNDSNSETYQVYWIHYDSSLVHYSNIGPNQSFGSQSGKGHSWLLKNGKKCLTFRLGETPFLKSNCDILTSNITHSIEFDHDIEKEQTTEIDSCIFVKGTFHEDSARQGAIGDCYLLQCLSSISSRYPGVITSKFLNLNSFKETGVILLKLYSKSNKCWRLVVLDDFLPIDNNNNYYGVGPSGPLNNEFWASILEKGFAKYKSSFPHLEANRGFGINDIYDMILGPNEMICLNIPENGDDQIMNKLLNYYKSGSVISLSSRHNKNNNLINSKTGVVNYHGYGLLDIRENVCNTGITLIKAHNVWSQGGEWKGAWSDDSDLWKKYPNISNELKMTSKNDGIFWIDIKDFHKAFEVLWIATMPKNSPVFLKESSNVRSSVLTPISN